MLADGNGEFAEAVGLTMDGSKFGMGKRSQRYSMVVNDGVVEQLNVEAPGEYQASSAETYARPALSATPLRLPLFARGTETLKRFEAFNRHSPNKESISVPQHQRQIAVRPRNNPSAQSYSVRWTTQPAAPIATAAAAIAGGSRRRCFLWSRREPDQRALNSGMDQLSG